MYQTPTLVRYGGFRELTLQNPGQSCPTVPMNQKIDPSLDALFGPGQNNDGCPPRS